MQRGAETQRVKGRREDSHPTQRRSVDTTAGRDGIEPPVTTREVECSERSTPPVGLLNARRPGKTESAQSALDPSTSTWPGDELFERPRL